MIRRILDNPSEKQNTYDVYFGMMYYEVTRLRVTLIRSLLQV
jgi:hypothetical protein